MSQFQIEPNCNRCKLHQYAHTKSVCLKGRNTERKKPLLVYTDTPDYFADNAHAPYKLEVYNFLKWMFDRMSVDINDVALDYTLRCYAGKDLPTTKAARATCIEECAEFRFDTIEKVRPKAIVCLGQTSLEAFTGKTKIGEHTELQIHCWEPVVRDHVQYVFVAHSVLYCLVSPSETPRVFRVLFRAAEEAELKPKLNPTVPPFQWRNLK